MLNLSSHMVLPFLLIVCHEEGLVLLLNFLKQFFQTKHGSWSAQNLPPSLAGYPCANRGGVPIKYINGKPAALARGHVKHIKSKGKKGKKNKVKETYDLIVNIDLVSQEENFLGFMHR